MIDDLRRLRRENRELKQRNDELERWKAEATARINRMCAKYKRLSESRRVNTSDMPEFLRGLARGN